MKNIIILFFYSLLLASCIHNHDHAEGDGHNHSTQDAPDHIEMEEEHEADEVGLTALQMEKIGLKLGGFEQKNLKSTVKVNGELELPPQNKADVSSIVAGKITQISVQPGQRVKKGTILARLQNPNFIEWQQQYLETEGELLYLNKEWERLKNLVAKEISPKKQLDKIESERAIAQAKLKGLKSKLQLLGLGIPTGKLYSTIALRSPMNGYVREIKANTGVFVQPEMSLFEIVDNHHLHIDLKVFEKDLPYIKEGQVIQFSLQSQPDELMNAYIFAIGKALNRAERTVDIHAEIKEEKANLLPGMFVEARIILDDKKVPTLPDDAITVDKGLFYIFVKEEVHEAETHFKKVPVLKGATDFGYTEVRLLEPLADNVEIVTEGAYFLMAQSKKGEEGAGHHH